MVAQFCARRAMNLVFLVLINRKPLFLNNVCVMLISINHRYITVNDGSCWLPSYIRYSYKILMRKLNDWFQWCCCVRLLGNEAIETWNISLSTWLIGKKLFKLSDFSIKLLIERLVWFPLQSMYRLAQSIYVLTVF